MPVRIDAYEEMEPGEFDRLPRPTPPVRVDPVWEELLAKLDQGRELRLPVADESSLRGLRLALGRRAAGKGFRVETRVEPRGDGLFLAVRKSERPLGPKPPRDTSPEPAGTPRRRGRPRKQPAA